MATISKREQILTALGAFVAQRPGLEFGNYGDVRAYRQEMRSITRDRHIAEKLLAQVAWRESIGEAELRDAFRAYSGRLSLHDVKVQHSADDCPGKPCGSCCDHVEDKGVRLEYCTGQYFPTEYRKAVCAVLASALWYYYRGCMPEPSKPHGALGQTQYRAPNGNGFVSGGEWLRSTFRREFGRDIASRFFY